MAYRYLGNSGLKISDITYGNWLTHGGQVENDVATACVRAALEHGITTFDTADVYANTVAEQVLGDALKGQRRESLEIFTKVWGPTGPKGPNDSGLSRKHILESINGSLRRLGTDYVDLYQAHRYDPETPLEETMLAFSDVVRQGKALYIGVSEWTADQLRAGHALASELRHPSHLEPAAVQHAVARDRGGGRPRFEGARHLADRLVADRARRAHGQVQAGRGGSGRFSGDGCRWREDRRALPRRRASRGRAEARADRGAGRAHPRAARDRVGAQQPERRLRHHRRLASEQVADNVKASGTTLEQDVLDAIDEALGSFVERDPSKTDTPTARPS